MAEWVVSLSAPITPVFEAMIFPTHAIPGGEDVGWYEAICPRRSIHSHRGRVLPGQDSGRDGGHPGRGRVRGGVFLRRVGLQALGLSKAVSHEMAFS